MEPLTNNGPRNKRAKAVSMVQNPMLVDDVAAVGPGIRPSCPDGRNRDVLASSGGADDLRRVAARGRALALINLELDTTEGLALLYALRSRLGIPIVVVTGHRCDKIDRMASQELGIDGYVSTSFSLRQFLVRIRAMLRCHESDCQGCDDQTPDGYRFGEWELDLKAHRLTGKADESLLLTKGEYALLLAFLVAPNRPLSRDHLLRTTRLHADISDRSIDVQVLRLRRKLESGLNGPCIIQTQRGVGYEFMLSVEPFVNSEVVGRIRAGR